MGLAGRGLAKRMHAWVLAHLTGAYEERIAERKRLLLGELTGVVLEIGPGAGPNLRYYRPEVRWIGVEPSPYLQEYLRKEAARLGRTIEIKDGAAERLDVQDASVDAVVSTLVLCSVADPAATLREVRRVLKPGGRFVFIEHVAAEPGTLLFRWQRRLRRPWQFIADGCRPDQDTVGLIREAGFTELQVEGFTMSFPLVGPHVAGWGTVGWLRRAPRPREATPPPTSSGTPSRIRAPAPAPPPAAPAPSPP